MTWITCKKCGYVGTVSSINVVLTGKEEEDGSLEVAEIYHGATRWKCPACERKKIERMRWKK